MYHVRNVLEIKFYPPWILLEFYFFITGRTMFDNDIIPSVVNLQDSGAGLVAAALISIVPGYISRSVAGSYDNEGIAIFCMLFTYTCWIKSVKTGSLFWAIICSLAYFYMVSRSVTRCFRLETSVEGAFSVAAPIIWNELPTTLKSCESLASFRKHLKTYLFKIAFPP